MGKWPYILTVIGLGLSLLTCTNFQAVRPSVPTPVYISPVGEQGLNFSANQSASFPSVFGFGGKLYAVWAEVEDGGGGQGQIRVAVFNGNESAPAWSFVDGGAAKSIVNRDPLLPTPTDSAPRLASYDGGLYVAWTEHQSVRNRFVTRVSLFNENFESPAWADIDQDPQYGLNLESSSDAISLGSITLEDEFFLAWTEKKYSTPTSSQLKLMSYKSSGWTHIKRNGKNELSEKGNPGFYSNNPFLWRHNSRLYVAWQEIVGVGQIRVIAYDNEDTESGADDDDWIDLDANQANFANLSYINRNSYHNADAPKFVSFNSLLHLIWVEENTSSVPQVRVSRLNSDLDAPVWTPLDGNDAEVGINYDPTKAASEPTMRVINGNLVAFWVEAGPDGATQIRAAKYDGDGSSWSFVDGNKSTGINLNTSKSASHFQVTSFNGRLCLIWREEASNGTFQIRAAFDSILR